MPRPDRYGHISIFWFVLNNSCCEVTRQRALALPSFATVMLRASGAAMTPGIHHMSDVACSDTRQKSNRL